MNNKLIWILIAALSFNLLWTWSLYEGRENLDKRIRDLEAKVSVLEDNFSLMQPKIRRP